MSSPWIYAPAAPFATAQPAPAVPFALAPVLDDLRRQFERFSADADAFVDALGEEQFRWRPRPDAWSIAECLEHLNVTARVALPRFDEAIAEAIGRGTHSDQAFVPTWIDRFVVRTTEPPSGWPMNLAVRPSESNISKA